MIELSKNQKMIFGGLAIFIVAVITYYIMDKNTSVDYSTLENAYDNEQNNDIQLTGDTVIDLKTDIVIHITGSVNFEGIVRVKEGSRISDVVDAAGGLKEDADLSKVNLAYIISDGQKIYIPSIYDNQIEEKEDSVAEQTTEKSTTKETNESELVTSSSGKNVIVSTTTQEEQQQVQNSVVNINTANQAQLETLPGIGPSTASKIIEYRNEFGKFKIIEDIKNVSGIGEAKYNAIKNKICI